MRLVSGKDLLADFHSVIETVFQVRIGRDIFDLESLDRGFQFHGGELLVDLSHRFAAPAERTEAGRQHVFRTQSLQVAEDIRDRENNTTRFICISKTLEIYGDADKTSVILTIPHKPGALAKILSRFDALHINLTKLESRPIPERDFEFRFYFDLVAEAGTPVLLHILSELSGESEEFRYLGTYTELL